MSAPRTSQQRDIERERRRIRRELKRQARETYRRDAGSIRERIADAYMRAMVQS
jgi:F0F1-type ATP synthase membrane subunit b/b'